MTVLSVDTSVSDITISLKVGSGGYDECVIEKADGKALSLLVPKINELCAARGIKVKDIDLFICTKGPGSFTGLRIGMATLKGMAYAGGKPLVSVPTSAVYASAVEDYDGCVVTAIDAKKQRYYLAVYEVRNGLARRQSPDIDGNAEDIIPYLNGYDKILVTGPKDDVLAFSEKLSKELKDGKTVQTEFERYKTFGMALYEQGLLQYENCGPDDISSGPLYVRKSDAEMSRSENKV